jgi:hypothetical protein
MRRALACLLFAIAGCPDVARVQWDDGWLGRRVVLKLGAELQKGYMDETRFRDAAPRGVFRTYRVVGHRFRLAAEVGSIR